MESGSQSGSNDGPDIQITSDEQKAEGAARATGTKVTKATTATPTPTQSAGFASVTLDKDNPPLDKKTIKRLAKEAAARSGAIDNKTEAQASATSRGGHISVIAAICGNIAVAIVKFIAAIISNSTAMLSEGIHSIVDSGNGILVLLGMKRSKKEPDYLHPFGYGKELYFWVMVVSLLIFFMGGVMSLYQGITAIQEASAGTKVMGDMTMNFIVLLAGMVIEGTTLSIAVKQFNIARGEVPPIRFIHDTKDPTIYTVVLEDSAAELGLLAALIANIIYVTTGNMYADGIASIFIGVLLCVVGSIILCEAKGLLVGEGMKHQSLDEIREIVEADPSVMSCGRILTMYVGPDSLLVTIDATFQPDVSAYTVLRAVDNIENRLKTRWPQITQVFIEAESLRNVVAQQLEEENWEDADEGETGEQLDG